LLTRTEEFDDVVWSKNAGSVTANVATAPDGTVSADRFVEDTSTTIHRVSLTTLTLPLVPVAASIHVLKSETRRFYLNTVAIAGASALFDVSEDGGVVVATGGLAPNRAAEIVDLGDYYRCTVYGTGTGVTNNFWLQLAEVTHVGASDDSYLGDGVSGLTFWGAQLELGSTATEYQRVGSTYDVTEAGQADNWHLVFDGVDDHFEEITGVVTPEDGSIIVAGVDGKEVAGSRNGMFAFVGAQSAAADHFGGDGSFADLFVTAFGTVRVTPVNDDSALNNLQVATFHHDSGTLRYRRDGAEIGTASSTLASSACSIWLGRSKYTFAVTYFSGNLYGLIVRGATSTTDEITNTEAYLAAKSGVTL
jgi:hypothetical protein